MKRTVGIIGVIMLGCFVWLRARREDVTERPPPEIVTPAQLGSLGGGGIGTRPSSPSNAVASWRDPSLTTAEIADATHVDLAAYYAEAGSVAFDDIEPLVGWVDGAATDDDFGREVASCRYAHERRAAQHPCRWKQTLTVRQRGGEGEVVGVEPETPDTVHTECAAFIKCMQNAWRGRPAPEMLSGDGVYQVTAEARLPRFGEGFADWTDEEYADAYAAEIERKETLLDQRAAYVDEAKASGEWALWSDARRDSFLHNQAQSAARLVDAQMMLARIRG